MTEWLQVQGDSALAFLVISAFEAVPEYTPEIPDEDVRSLGLEDPQDALVFNIVTLRKGGRSTLNLKGPIVINRLSMIGKQVVPDGMKIVTYAARGFESMRGFDMFMKIAKHFIKPNPQLKPLTQCRIIFQQVIGGT